MVSRIDILYISNNLAIEISERIKNNLSQYQTPKYGIQVNSGIVIPIKYIMEKVKISPLYRDINKKKV